MLTRLTPSKKTILLVIAGVIAFVAAVALCVVLLPYFQQLSDPVVQEAFRAKIADLGVGGWFLFLLLQIMQIIIAFIPGEIVQLLSGVLYGVWGGVFTCLLGSLIASTLIFLTVRKLGDRLVVRLFGKNKLEEYAFLRDSERIETVTFLLFLIPGIPKDLLTYLAGISRIAMGKFLAISTLARIPALTVSTMVGASASRGDIGTTAVLVAGVTIIALVGVVYRARIMRFLRGHGAKKIT